ncbi:MAG: ROK family transcriptional regulator [Candidatus Omnitrophota bacterium]|nr:ROK family transcriptional regulator [Candidatus Omnitrophota bacterium]
MKLNAGLLSERSRKNLAILDAIRRAGPISKAEISKSVGLNVVTISNYIDELLRLNLVLEKDLDVSGGGRRPVLLGLNPEAGLSIGVGTNLFNTVAVSVDLSGKIFTHMKIDKKTNDVKEVVNSILEIIRKTLDSIEPKDKIKGIGLGIAGIIDKEKDSVRWPQKLADSYNYATITLPLKDIIEKEFGLPCLIENDATAACFGEQWLTLSPEVKNVLFLFSGVGCGIMINGDIYHGSTGCAGEISIYSQAEDKDFNCASGNPCFLKRWEADLGMIEEARRILKSGRESSKILEKAGSLDNVTLRDIFDAAKAKDEVAISIIKNAGRRLGIRAAYLVNIFNPQVLIIGGGMEEVSEILLDVVRRAVSEWAFEEMAREVKIIPSSLGENAVALGAANLVIRQVFSQT